MENVTVEITELDDKSLSVTITHCGNLKEIQRLTRGTIFGIDDAYSVFYPSEVIVYEK